MSRNVLRLAGGLISLVLLGGMTLPEAAVHEGVQAHRRNAAAYLRTGNADLALNEIEALEARLEGEAKALASAARKAAEAGDLAAATESVARLRSLFAGSRKSRGLRTLADCIAEAEAALAAIDGASQARPSLATDRAIDGIRTRAAEARAALARCDGEAPREIAKEPEFRRLVDGATASLGLIPAALDKRDPELLHRLMIELKSFERLLVQRFG